MIVEGKGTFMHGWQDIVAADFQRICLYLISQITGLFYQRLFHLLVLRTNTAQIVGEGYQKTTEELRLNQAKRQNTSDTVRLRCCHGGLGIT